MENVYDRKRVFDLIDRERRHQDEKWGGANHDAKNSIGDWLTFMRVYLEKADKAWTSEDPGDVIDEIVKVAALSVACLEYNRD